MIVKETAKLLKPDMCRRSSCAAVLPTARHIFRIKKWSSSSPRIVTSPTTRCNWWRSSTRQSSRSWSIPSNRWMTMRRCCAKTLPAKPAARMASASIIITSLSGRSATSRATDEAFNKAEVTIKELIPYHRTHPCPLETCSGFRHPSTRSRASSLCTARFKRHMSSVRWPCFCRKIPEAQDLRHRAGYRRRFRQQGRRLFGLYLRDRCVDRYRRAGEMGGRFASRTSRPPRSHATIT